MMPSPRQITRDDILPIERCGREVVREARRDGYDVRFVEFDGGHTVPDDVAGAAMDWLLARSRSSRPR